MTTSATQLADHASSSTKNRQTLWAFLALLGAVLLWGTSYAATKTAITHFSPMLLIWLRMVMASLILLPFWRKLPKPDYRPGDAKWLLGLGLLQPCLYFLLEVQALHYSTSSQVGAVAALAPLFVAFFAWIWLKERMSVAAIAGLLLSYHLGWPTSPTIILTLGLIYFLSLLAGPQGGLMWRYIRQRHLEA